MENNRNVHDEIVYVNRVENAIIDAKQGKTTSLSLSKQNITDGLKICGQIVYNWKSGKF